MESHSQYSDPPKYDIAEGTRLKKKLNANMVILLIAAALIVTGCLINGVSRFLRHTFPPAGNSVVPTPTPDPLASKGVLLLGYGGGKHEGADLTDTMILTYIIPREKRMTLVSIPRDIWVKLPLYPQADISYKINAAFAIGADETQYKERIARYTGKHSGGILAKDVVSDLLGLPNDYYVALDFSGFQKIVDILGGIDVAVPFAFTDSYYPVEGKEKETCGKSEEEIKKTTATLSGFFVEKEFPCRFETVAFTKGITHMDGKTALAFVRSRHSDQNGGDFGRSLRQQAFLKALKEKILSPSSIPKLPSLISKFSSMMETDISLGDVPAMLTTYGDVSSFTMSAIALTEDNVLVASTSANGQYILVPKDSEKGWQSVKEFIAAEVAKSGTPSASVTP